MEKLTKVRMMKTFNNHRGSLPEGEMVKVISINESAGSVKVTDPFDREWEIPVTFVDLS